MNTPRNVVLAVGLAVGLAVALGGCAQIKGWASTAKAQAAEIADAALATGIYTTCQAPSRGALIRKFPKEADREAFESFCAANSDKQNN